MKKILATTMALATAVTFSLGTAQKANAVEAVLAVTSIQLSAMSFVINQLDKDIRQQAANDAIVYLADGQSSDILNNILSEVRASKAELADLSDKEISKEIIRAAIQK